MGAYHQMGHDSENLLSEPDLGRYQGAILSPVNYAKPDVIAQIRDHSSDKFEMIFDPQLYFPDSVRGELPKWSYFPADVDTADQTSSAWWSNIVKNLTDCVKKLQPHAICSPAVVPRTFSSEYYHLTREVAEDLAARLSKTKIAALQTVLVRLGDLTDQDKPPEIASIVTGASLDRVFLVFITEVEPRRELANTEDLKGAMRLIKHIEDAGIRVLVGFVSSDVILWKNAGATDCATGKFFNLRRFTPSRWDLPAEGGGQLAYWFEESLMAYLRESDLLRLQKANLLSKASTKNPYACQILELRDSDPDKPWLALSWRQYMYWFCDFEERFSAGDIPANRFLRNAEEIWQQLEENDILMEERQNDGGWLRAWRRAILELRKGEQP